MLYRFFTLVTLCLLPSLCYAQNSLEKVVTAPTKEPLIIARLGMPSPLIRYSEAETAHLATLSGEAIVLPVMATADDELIVCNEDSLENSNAEDVFSERLEEVEEFSVLDLSLNELHSLEFATQQEGFTKTASLKRHLEIIKAIRDQEKQPLKIIFELRKPWLHKQKGKDLSALLLRTLSNAQLPATTEIMVSSYDPDELEHFMALLPQSGHKVHLMFIMGDTSGEEAKQDNFGSWQSYDYGWLYTTTGLRFISSFAQSIAFNTKTMLMHKEKNIDFVLRSKDFGLKFWIIEKDIRLDALIGDNFTMESIDGIESSQPERFIHVPTLETQPEQEESTAPITALLSELNISTTQ